MVLWYCSGLLFVWVEDRGEEPSCWECMFPVWCVWSVGWGGFEGLWVWWWQGEVVCHQCWSQNCRHTYQDKKVCCCLLGVRLRLIQLSHMLPHSRVIILPFSLVQSLGLVREMSLSFPESRMSQVAGFWAIYIFLRVTAWPWVPLLVVKMTASL